MRVIHTSINSSPFPTSVFPLLVPGNVIAYNTHNMISGYIFVTQVMQVVFNKIIFLHCMPCFHVFCVPVNSFLLFTPSIRHKQHFTVPIFSKKPFMIPISSLASRDFFSQMVNIGQLEWAVFVGPFCSIVYPDSSNFFYFVMKLLSVTLILFLHFLSCSYIISWMYTFYLLQSTRGPTISRLEGTLFLHAECRSE